MGLDINSEKGQETLVYEREAAAIYERHNPSVKYIHTPKGTDATIDAVLIKGDQLLGIAGIGETKCRYNTLDDLQGPFDNEWLVSNKKIEDSALVAAHMHVPYIGLLYLVYDQTLLVQTLFEPGKTARGWIPNIRTKWTTTQATCNGGKAYRENAFIDMSEATILR